MTTPAFAPGDIVAARRAPRCICSAPSDQPPSGGRRVTSLSSRFGGAVGSRRGHVDALRALPPLAERLRHPCPRHAAPGRLNATPHRGAFPSPQPSPAVPWGDLPPQGVRRRGGAVPRDGVPRGARPHRRASCASSRPRGDESLHRLRPLDDGFDRWQTAVALLEQGVWRSASRRSATTSPPGSTPPTSRSRREWMPRSCASSERCCSTAPRPRSPARSPSAACSTAAAARLRDSAVDDDGRARRSSAIPRSPAYFAAARSCRSSTVGDDLELLVERERAGVGAWYEFFPRSEGARRLKDGTIKSGTFRTAAKRLPGGRRDGLRRALPAADPPDRPDQPQGPQQHARPAARAIPGSPWAIGAAEGGHDTVHPDLGTLADFRAFVRAARADGHRGRPRPRAAGRARPPLGGRAPRVVHDAPGRLDRLRREPAEEVPGHLPDQLRQRPGGASAPRCSGSSGTGSRRACSIFRVDNPHTKPLQFWEWLIATVNAEHPDVVFLAEAFTRPAPLQSLASAGFQQSYTYFTWRNTKAELEEFLGGLAHETADFLRPNLFVNTPDILTEYLQFGGRPAYRIRAAIAATAAPTYGVYAGYELYENVARPGSEENIDNEKYEYKFRDWAGAEAARRLARAVPHAAQRDPPRAPRARASCATSASTGATTTRSWCTPSTSTPRSRPTGAATRSSSSPTPTRTRCARRWCTSTPASGASSPASRSRSRTCSPARSGPGRITTSCMLDAFTEPVHILHVKEPR